MSAEVVSLHGYRNRTTAPSRKCPCDPAESWVCYPHRLVDLAARVEDLKSDVENFRFCDMATFERLTSDVLNVVASITEDCDPGSRPGERNVR